MTAQAWKNAPPIYIGYDAEIPVSYAQDFWDLFLLGTGRIVAQFRKSIAEPVLFQADSEAAPPSIIRPGENGLLIKIPAIKTATFGGASDIVVFSFARASGEARIAIPGLWTWPVEMAATRDAF